MTDATHLYRGNERGEILDADGQVVGRIVPPIPKLAMIIRGEQHGENAGGIYRAMLSAAPTDWSSVAVRVPETTGFDGPFAAGMQHALDAILGAK
jgi:hypothetical protein